MNVDPRMGVVNEASDPQRAKSVGNVTPASVYIRTWGFELVRMWEEAVLTDDLVVLTAFGKGLGKLRVGLVAIDLRTKREYTNAMFERLAKSGMDRKRLVSALHDTARRPALAPAGNDTSDDGSDAQMIELAAGRGLVGLTLSRLGSWIVGMVAVLDDHHEGRSLPPNAVVAQHHGLTRREAEVAGLLARGLKNAEIALTLKISPFTARRHTERVLMKLGAKSRAGVAARLLGLTTRTEPTAA